MEKVKLKNKTKNLTVAFFTMILLLALLAPSSAFALPAYTNATSNSSSTVYCLPNTSSMVIGSIGIETVKVYWQESGYYYIEYVVSGGGYSGYKRGYVPTSKINVSGIDSNRYIPWTSNTASNQTVYNRAITTSLVIGQVYSTDTITVLEEDGSWYFIQYPITGGYKRGYLPKSTVYSMNGPSWNYYDYSHGSYTSKTGYSMRTNYSNWFTTTVNFNLDSYNVTNILDYNNGGDNPGDKADGLDCYLTLDQSAIGQNPDDLEISASSIVSNLPDPKYDLESDDADPDLEESEVVALGSVSATSYYMRTAWNDSRDGGSTDGGTIQAQFAMSHQTVPIIGDYNNVIQSDVIQAFINYGDNLGQP